MQSNFKKRKEEKLMLLDTGECKKFNCFNLSIIFLQTFKYNIDFQLKKLSKELKKMKLMNEKILIGKLRFCYEHLFSPLL